MQKLALSHSVILASSIKLNNNISNKDLHKVLLLPTWQCPSRKIVLCHLRCLEIPVGAEFYIVSDDEALGPYTHMNNKVHRSLRRLQ